MSDYQKPPEFDYLTKPKQEKAWLVTQPEKECHRPHPDPPVSYDYKQDPNALYAYGREIYYHNTLKRTIQYPTECILVTLLDL